ncbi:uncharacterized protein BDZ99DRAFT_501088 [Mytilinidion resinicola]|uniref:Uncharacterized protein n=1 Tax=Mytilinidion resinicola TaxID=574789 RepID=A0A6A6YBG9_9PEZI|nr:uncharacterized protein BDZ99DRAFT_501088 [Mytilinidion resinicola]KAF2806176.1 hypothetical protein BDZ99DRAFT_501088 [Mytilinidion resinicola]
MEQAPLTLAQNHVRNAVAATANSDVSTASAEHELAAQHFAKAAQTTGDPEALRILALLESQHHRLASIIKTPAARASVASPQDPQSESTASSVRPRRASPGAPGTRSASPASTSSPSRPATRRRPSRDPASSIVTNLANARGIPGAQPKRGLVAGATVSVANAIANAPSRLERRSRAEGQESPPSAKDAIQRQARRVDETKTEGSQRRPQSLDNGQQSQVSQASETATATSDDRFHKFYSTFENVFSAISAPLAFASLPLGPSSTPTPPAPNPAPAPIKPVRSTTTDEPDYTTLISKPALRALREDPDRNGRFGGAAESFYVVPPSGGTVSYAGILQHTSGHLPDLIEETSSDRGSQHDEFVDAMETPYPPSPTAPRHVRRKPNANAATKPPPNSIPAGRGAGRKTVEEIELENTTLRALLDKQSRRLQMWEATSQSQSLALAASLRNRGPPGIHAATSDPSALAHAAQGANMMPPPPIPAAARTPSSRLKSSTGPQPIPDASSTSATATAPATVVDDVSAAKIAELTQLLEAQLQAAEQARKEQERTAAQNEKLKGVLGQYRERWEALKTEARKRRNGAKAPGTTTPIEEGVETSEVREEAGGEGGGDEKKEEGGVGVETP